MYCDECGTRIPDAAKFCRACGTRLAAVPAGQHKGTQGTSEAVDQPVPERGPMVLCTDLDLYDAAGFCGEDADKPTTGATEAPPKEKKRDGLKTKALIIMVAIIGLFKLLLAPTDPITGEGLVGALFFGGLLYVCTLGTLDGSFLHDDPWVGGAGSAGI
jgi:hypothetical protein